MKDKNMKAQETAKPVVVITGCSSGIGRETARYLKEWFCRVYPTARTEAEVAELREEGFEGAMRLDVRRPDEIAAVIAEVLRREGRIDMWFNNAGYGQLGAVEDLPTDALRDQFETNLFGLHECTRQVLAVMRRQGGGKIIQHSSVLGLVAMPMRGAYVASKFAVEGLTDALRLELSGTPIRIVLLDTGPIHSRFRANALRTLERIDIEGSRWRTLYRKALRGEITRVPFSKGPEAVASVVHRILLDPDPKARYRITPATVLLDMARRFLPDGLLDRILRRY